MTGKSLWRCASCPIARKKFPKITKNIALYQVRTWSLTMELCFTYAWYEPTGKKAYCHKAWLVFQLELRQRQYFSSHYTVYSRQQFHQSFKNVISFWLNNYKKKQPKAAYSSKVIKFHSPAFFTETSKRKLCLLTHFSPTKICRAASSGTLHRETSQLTIGISKNGIEWRQIYCFYSSNDWRKPKTSIWIHKEKKNSRALSNIFLILLISDRRKRDNE